MSNIIRHNGKVAKKDRNRLNRHDSGIIWLEGLSAAGKSTIAYALEHLFHEKGIRAYVLDGDNIRHGLNADLQFTREDRDENLRRVVEVAKLFIDAGILVIAAFITPFEEQRTFIRSHLEKYNLIELYVRCSIDKCIERDPKGLYKKALSGMIPNYTGISSPFEEPCRADIIIDTQNMSVNEAISTIYQYVETKKRMIHKI